MIRFGYACKTIAIPQTSMRTCTLKQAILPTLIEVSKHNLAAIGHMVRYTANQGLGLLRISSDVIPLASHPAVNFAWRSYCEKEVHALSRIIHDTGIRLSMHPGQYTVLNSPHTDVVERSTADLAFHANFLDALNAPLEAKIVLHIGGVYGDKAAALQRFASEFNKLPDYIQQRIALENDEHNFAIDDVLALSNTLKLPVIFDVFHHSILPAHEYGTVLDWISHSGTFWHKLGVRQKIHYSQQLPQGKRGSHSKTICIKEFMEFYHPIKALDLDIMLEVKDKNLSATKCHNLCLHPPLRRALTEEWSRYKYLVLEHSSPVYLAIREYLNSVDPEAFQFYSLIENALNTPVTLGGIVNAAQHVWGHLKEKASKAEVKRIQQSIDECTHSDAKHMLLKKQLWNLAVKQQEPYLLRSLYFCDHMTAACLHQ